MATHFSILAWKIPGTEDPDRLESMRLQRVSNDCVYCKICLGTVLAASYIF